MFDEWYDENGKVECMLDLIKRVKRGSIACSLRGSYGAIDERRGALSQGHHMPMIYIHTHSVQCYFISTQVSRRRLFNVEETKRRGVGVYCLRAICKICLMFSSIAFNHAVELFVFRVSS